MEFKGFLRPTWGSNGRLGYLRDLHQSKRPVSEPRLARFQSDRDPPLYNAGRMRKLVILSLLLTLPQKPAARKTAGTQTIPAKFDKRPKTQIR